MSRDVEVPMGMPDHDPLCESRNVDGFPCYTCALIARVRRDNDREWLNNRGKSMVYAAALREAVEAVKALPPITDAYPTSSPAGGEGLSIVTRTWLCNRDSAVAAIEALGGER